MLTIPNFIANLKALNAQTENALFGIACSGGVDSLALAFIMHKAKLPILLLHCNFGLRGAESDADETFVAKTAEDNNMPILLKKFNTNAYALENKVNIQEAARKLRYNWFLEVLNARPEKFKYLCTAHHKDDNTETLLFNFLRGATIKGLQGIPENYNLGQVNVLRPFLQFSKKDIIEYCKAENINWVEDISNQSIKYDRNFLRLDILPKVYERQEHAQEKILGNINRFKQYEETINYHAAHVEMQLANDKIGKLKLINEIAIPIKKVQKLGLTYCAAYFEKLGFTYAQLPEIEKLFTTSNGKYVKGAHGNNGLYKFNNWLICKAFEINNTTEDGHYLIEKDDENIKTQTVELSITTQQKNNAPTNKNANEAFLDTKNIIWPLILRRPKDGDYFYPLGMQKKKKLSRFFIDEKIPKEKRAHFWVLESDRKIIWVVGLRINDKFKINENTKEVLHFLVSSLV